MILHCPKHDNLLAWRYIVIFTSFGIVFYKPCVHHFLVIQGVNKGLIAERLLAAMQKKEMLPDFVLCIGDDRSDEDMFEVIMSAANNASLSPVAEVFACTVGQKPSKAKYYLEDTPEILRMLQGLAAASEQCTKTVSRPSHRVIIEREWYRVAA